MSERIERERLQVCYTYTLWACRYHIYTRHGDPFDSVIVQCVMVGDNGLLEDYSDMNLVCCDCCRKWFHSVCIQALYIKAAGNRTHGFAVVVESSGIAVALYMYC